MDFVESNDAIDSEGWKNESDEQGENFHKDKRIEQFNAAYKNLQGLIRIAN